jgi:hypothetical protein
MPHTADQAVHQQQHHQQQRLIQQHAHAIQPPVPLARAAEQQQRQQQQRQQQQQHQQQQQTTVEQPDACAGAGVTVSTPSLAASAGKSWALESWTSPSSDPSCPHGGMESPSQPQRTPGGSLSVMLRSRTWLVQVGHNGLSCRYKAVLGARFCLDGACMHVVNNA